MDWLPNLPVFAGVGAIMVCSPGPNMIYLVSRAVSQGTRAGLLSLVGTAAAFVLYMLLSVFGLTAMLLAVPIAYEAIRFAGAAYLLYLAWGAIRPGGRSPFELRSLAPDGRGKLILMAFVTNLLNPKAAVLYLTLLPQFIRPEKGHVLAQGLALGLTQMTVSLIGNAAFIMSAGSLAELLARRPIWRLVQRWLMGCVLAGLAVRMLAEARN